MTRVILRGIPTPTRTKPRVGYFVRLVSHFLTRFFTAELTAEQSDLRLGIGVILALLSLPGAFVSLLLMPKYSSFIRLLYHLPPIIDYETFSILDKYMFVAYAMAITGLAAVAMWDRLFPDRLDHAALAPLPVSMRQMFLAKLLALALFFTLFVVTSNLGSCALFPLQVEGNQPKVGPWARLVLAHMAATVAGGLFAFFVVFVLVGALTLVVLGRWFQPVSFAFQLLGTLALVLLLFSTFGVEAVLPQAVNGGH